MKTTGLASDLQWWADHRGAPDPDRAAMREVLERLQAWKVQHDDDRARQPGPFFKMVWDGIFGDEDGDVADAIAELEAALAER